MLVFVGRQLVLLERFLPFALCATSLISVIALSLPIVAEPRSTTLSLPIVMSLPLRVTYIYSPPLRGPKLIKPTLEEMHAAGGTAEEMASKAGETGAGAFGKRAKTFWSRQDHSSTFVR